MVQRFIELGEGYSDLYELLEIIRSNQHRIVSFLELSTIHNGKKVTTVGVIMSPTDPGNFQAIYICREGITDPRVKETKRWQLFHHAAEESGKPVYQFDVKPSSVFHEPILYYQYLTGILRLNHILPPLN
ncbi:methylthioribose kinase [Metabacillus sp. KIGAM252]|uniref:Methylthioribose kinase n=1 Tax=Metabacillus flavus TaxID=2823519 RepID=A0ABS5LDQ3_9BACI|nr:methylthioribose kinase [Metabacillus flavus]MBS2968852.1 methylthioribose kinase [Metabacillus flavus]